MDTCGDEEAAIAALTPWPFDDGKYLTKRWVVVLFGWWVFRRSRRAEPGRGAPRRSRRAEPGRGAPRGAPAERRRSRAGGRAERRAEREEKLKILERKGFWWGSGDSREMMVLVMSSEKLEVK